MSEVRALLLTDVVDSTQLAGVLGDATMAGVWASHDRLARELLPQHGGREIDKTDGMLLMFSQAAEAVRYAAAYHQALASLTPPLKARAGLHVGPVILRENPPEDVARGAKPLEVDGMAKPTAARVMALANGGQTLLSADALKALNPPAETVFSHGHWRLKGVPQPMELFEVGEPPFQALPDGDKAYQVVRNGERWLPVRQVPNNLPQQPTSFLGRERELDDISAALKTSRLVTLLGMGGLGKTRLALQVAAESLAEYPDGAWFLDLSPLREPALVVEEAARLLQVQEEPGRPLIQTLCAHVKERRLLLVIDNCEHLVQAAAALAHALLRAAAGVRLIATTREALRVPGETIYPVPPLPLPAVGSDASALSLSTAGRLFIERAKAQRAGFEVGDDVASQVAELVTRLEGIPLALELAAARVRSLSVADINARLKDRYKLLTGGSRVLQERQQTLRALVSWSYDLLQPEEQTLLQRLGVFIGGFELAAVEAVCGADPLDPLDLIDLLSSLVEKSLVMPEVSSGETRYRMLDTLREYALEKLEQGGEAADTRRLHCDHYWALARQARAGLQGPQQSEWVSRVECNLDNLRAAIATARSGGADVLLAAKIPVALQGFWLMRGRLSEGRELLRQAQELPGIQESDLARANILYAAAALAVSQGDAGEAQRLLETCLALHRKLDDSRGVANTLSTLTLTYLAAGRADAAMAAEQEAMELFRQQGHKVGEAIGLQHQGHILIFQGQLAAARRQVKQALELAQSLKNREIESECEWLLAEVARAEGDVWSGLAHQQRALQISRLVGDRTGEAKALAGLGRHSLEQGDTEAAREQLGQALRAFQSYEMRPELIECVEDHASLVQALGSADLGARLLAAAQTERAQMGLVVSPARQARLLAQQRLLRQQLGDAGFDAAWAAGSAWSLQVATSAATQVAPVLA